MPKNSFAPSKFIISPKQSTRVKRLGLNAKTKQENTRRLDDEQNRIDEFK